MAMTSAVDTKLLLTLEFPPDNITRDKARSFVQKELVNGMILPSIVLGEFLKIAGSKIGIQGAIRTINVLKERGAKVKSIDEELALGAGRLLLKHRDVPFADSLVAAFASIGTVDYILSDDPHFTALGIRTKWL
jgi:predicted nucleic acid-binding protein